MLYFMQAKNPDNDAEFKCEMIGDTGEYMAVTNINRCIFTGDTVQVGGHSLGRVMGNTILKVMDIMLTLPDDTKIFCAVEGTKANMRFGKKAEPEN